jgi:hypothetical protein
MSFEEVGGRTKFYKNNEMVAGQVICEGWYIAKKQGTYHPFYEFIDKAGQVHGINKTGQLDYLMEKIPLEEYVRVTFVGMEKMTKGAMAGKDAYKFKVERDPSLRGKRNAPVFEEVAAADATEEVGNPELPF